MGASSVQRRRMRRRRATAPVLRLAPRWRRARNHPAGTRRSAYSTMVALISNVEDIVNVGFSNVLSLMPSPQGLFVAVTAESIPSFLFRRSCRRGIYSIVFPVVRRRFRYGSVVKATTQLSCDFVLKLVGVLVGFLCIAYRPF